MPEVPSTAYVETGEGGRVAYQVSGEGPVDLLVAGGAPVPLDLLWEEPVLVRVRSRLSAFSRTLWVDQRGWGASDRDVDPMSWGVEDATDEQLTRSSPLRGVVHARGGRPAHRGGGALGGHRGDGQPGLRPLAARRPRRAGGCTRSAARARR